MVMRDRFDYFLVQKSIDNGTSLLDGTRVISVEEFPDYVFVKTEGGDFRSKVIVGADGVTSFVARSLRLRKKPRLGVAIEGEIFPNSDRAVDLSEYNSSIHIDFNVIPKGYGWIFPKKDHLSVGVFTTLPKMREIKKYFYIYVEKKGLCSNYSCRSLIGHQIPIGGKREVLNTRRGLLIGDAAGLADPITGEGIYFGLRSGQIAADLIDKGLNEGSFILDKYTEAVNNELINDFRYARYVSEFFYNLTPIIYKVGTKRNLISEDLVRAFVCGHPYKDIFMKIPKKIFNLFTLLK
jgi:flavin-dependent dehydrogenase